MLKDIFLDTILAYFLNIVMKRCVFEIALFIQFVTLTFSQHDTEFHFSKIAMQIPEHLGRRNYRLTWSLVPHLYEKDEVYISICLEKSTIIDIKNITYSNDGESETLVIEIDGLPFGSFETKGGGDWGRLWDQKRSSGFIGRSGMLPAGTHNITIRVNSTGDCYGVELWAFYIRLFTVVDHSSFWCNSGYRLSPRKWECLSNVEKRARLTNAAHTTSKIISTTTMLPPTHVNVTQNSFQSNCLDKKNVKIKFSTRNLVGTTISARHELLPLTSSSALPQVTEKEPRFCDTDIWQIGEVDSDNKEFASIYPGKSLVVNISYVDHPEKVFPGKLLPFVTTDITINFVIPKYIKMERGSAFLALGLFNLTKPVDVGLRYFDHGVNAFSDIHILTFTPQYQVMGWSIPHLGDTGSQENTFHLHFQSEANVIMFDFLKLQYNKRDERKYNSLIARTSKYRVRGLRYADSNGMKVVVDSQQEGLNMEDVLFLYQLTEFGLYETVLRIHSNGMFFPYKTFPVNVNVAERMIIDVSGVFFAVENHQSGVSTPTAIRSLHIDTANDVLIVNYVDGSVLHLLLTVTLRETKLEVIKFQGPPNSTGSQDAVFISTHVNSDFAGVNTLVADGRAKNILDNLDGMSGHLNYLLKRTSSNTLYYANNIIEFTFK